MHRDDTSEKCFQSAAGDRPSDTDLTEVPDARPRILAWRKGERERLISARMALYADRRAENSSAIVAGLDRVLEDVAGKTVSLYWPFRGEPDLRVWMESVNARGGTCLLPVVIEKGRPLIFRSWKKGEPLGRGVWNIPIPESGPERVPDVVTAPLVGFDAECYRLGYGGGFFDRTLAALSNDPLVIGVGYALQRIETIHPLAHDIPMDVIVTEEAVTWRSGAEMAP